MNKAIPKIRFREFRAEWSNRRLDDFAIVARGKSKHRPRDASFLYGGKYPFIQTGDIRAAELYITKFSQTYSDEGLKQSKLWNEGTLCITIAANIAETAILKIKACFPDSVIGLIPKDGQAEVLFVKHIFDKFKISIQTLSQGLAQANLNLEKLSSLKFFTPTLPEQQKIASFLSVVDEKIQQLTRKKELLEQYKKGVMQQLFSGKLRFKDENGKAYPKWEEKRLGEVSKIYDGTHQTPTYVKDGIPFYSVEHVTANQFSETKYISRDVFEKENEKVRLEKGDILMTKIGDIGTARLIDWEVEASFYVSLALLKQSKLISAKYLNQYIASRNFQLELWKRIIHVAFPKKINLGEIGNCKVLVPVKEEQQKIANFLSAIDTKIECVATQIEKTQTFKKGLLQQMFV